MKQTVDVVRHLPDRFLGGHLSGRVSPGCIIVLREEQIDYGIVRLEDAHVLQQLRCLGMHLQFDVRLDAQLVRVEISIIIVEEHLDVLDKIRPVLHGGDDTDHQFHQSAVADPSALHLDADVLRLEVVPCLQERLRQFQSDMEYLALCSNLIEFDGFGVVLVHIVESGQCQFHIRFDAFADHPLDLVYGVGPSAVAVLPVCIV